MSAKPKLYVRYMDNTGTLVNRTAQAERMLNDLNNRHNSIKFELELPSADGYLPILDTAIKINPDGSFSYKLHSAKANKQITLYNDPHHSDSTKWPLSTRKFVERYRAAARITLRTLSSPSPKN